MAANLIMPELPAGAANNGDEQPNPTQKEPAISGPAIVEPEERDEWGLPIRKLRIPSPSEADANKGATSPTSPLVAGKPLASLRKVSVQEEVQRIESIVKQTAPPRKDDTSDDEDFQDAVGTPTAGETGNAAAAETSEPDTTGNITASDTKNEKGKEVIKPPDQLAQKAEFTGLANALADKAEEKRKEPESPIASPTRLKKHSEDPKEAGTSAIADAERHQRVASLANDQSDANPFAKSLGSGGGVSEWSHQVTMKTDKDDVKEEFDDGGWQEMPAYAPYDIYDDDNKLVAKEAEESDVEDPTYAGLGGAGKGYTRVQLDEDAQSATSMDEHTSYLFKEVHGTSAAGPDDEEQRDAVGQMQATKNLLTEGQRIAYVGMTRLVLNTMVKRMEKATKASKGAKKECGVGMEAMRMWSQKMMIRLYAHMEISTEEQIMIEQLAEHGVEPADLTPTLMANARVKNPMAEKDSDRKSSKDGKDSETNGKTPSPKASMGSPRPSVSGTLPKYEKCEDEEVASPPPQYEEVNGEHLPEVRTPSQLPTTTNIDIDLRWTVLCDLFLTLIADSVYDSRSRVLLEQVGEHLQINWLDICRFEKRVTDALEMQQAAEKENWNEDEHKENRRKMALRKRYVLMGLATVGGGLVIGLSAGLLAPVIGGGLAAGFATIGVGGTAGFLGGAGGAAIITTAAATSGGVIAVRAADRRTGAVKTFEYRPLHNNKRVNLIVTVSGWMTGKVDDVRLPYSTVDPIMGDIYSVLWEPEMLRSMGDTINILATEALTQGLQQVLGNTILIGLMAALQLPVVLTKLSYLIDNPWTVSLDRAEAAGLILADSLIDRNLGTRPITFVGYSLGSRVIFSCLRELSKRGAHGLVQNVYLFGSPIVAKKDDYLKARSVVAGRFVNGYARNDWILGYLFRLTSGGISRVAGLAPVDDIPDLENVDVTDLVPGHMAYRTAMPKLLREVGWEVDSLEFSEIEDPDPENHGQRQRELINEIEEARREFERQEKEGKKSKFGFLSRKKKSAAAKKSWETYEESKGEPEDSSLRSKNESVLFDIDAIRRELESENFEVKELKSTLPPMKLDLASATSSPKPSVDRSKSADAVPAIKKNSFSYDEEADNVGSIHRPKKSFSYPYGHDDDYNRHQQTTHIPEEEVSMSFDTHYVTPPVSTRSGTPLAHLNQLPNSTLAPSTLNDEAGWGERTMEVSDRRSRDMREDNTAWKDKPLPDPQRPEMQRSAYTAPAPATGNVWDDDDDDEFKEKEMTMTFG